MIITLIVRMILVVIGTRICCLCRIGFIGIVAIVDGSVAGAPLTLHALAHLVSLSLLLRRVMLRVQKSLVGSWLKLDSNAS